MTSKAVAPKTLIVFGMRGTLLERIHSARVSPAMPPSTHTVGMHKIWARNGLNNALSKLTQELNCDIAVWSSTTTRNTIPVVQAVFGQKHPFKFVWTREQTIPDDFRRSVPFDAEDENATIKDLAEVWKQYPEYSPEHTIVVDDTPSKLRGAAENFVWLEGLGDGDAEKVKSDTHLTKFVEFVEKQIVTSKDVRQILPLRL